MPLLSGHAGNGLCENVQVGQAADRDHPHQKPKRVALWLGVSWVIVPLAFGFVSGNALIGVVAFGVWTSMSTIGFGIWASSRAASLAPATVHRSFASSTAFTPQGWALPERVVRRAEPPADEAESLDRLRLLWARIALAFSAVGFLVALLLGIASEPALGITTVMLTGYGLILAIGIFWWTVHNLKQGEPRPVLEQPGIFIVNLVVFVLFVALMYSITLAPSTNSPPVQWSFGDVLALLLFIAFLVAVVCWIRVTGRRWSLSYAFTHRSGK
jgi:hypothetical protein